jgi:hypothetical protein
MIELKALKQKLLKKWQGYGLQRAWLQGESEFPLTVKLPRPTDKTLLHDFAAVRQQIACLQAGLTDLPGIRLQQQEIHYPTMGRQWLPAAVEFADMAALAHFLGQGQAWRSFCVESERLLGAFPTLQAWLVDNPAQLEKQAGHWPELIAVCRYLCAHPRPNCYLRQLDIPGVETKFIERHRTILKSLLDQLLPEEAIDQTVTGLGDHGFERRFGLRYEEPQIRFRLLDSQLAAEFAGASDITLTVRDFAQLDLLVDRVFITENKINGLTFPEVRNGLVIFGLGYGVQLLKEVPWLGACQIHYWGDIDSHGFAMLSQLRSYFPRTRSLLMDEDTLLACRPLWGSEPAATAHGAEQLPHLDEAEQQLYQGLKAHWQPNLRLEQERIPFSLLEAWLQSLAAP